MLAGSRPLAAGGVATFISVNEGTHLVAEQGSFKSGGACSSRA